jgi:hypothetical protein
VSSFYRLFLVEYIILIIFLLKAFYGFGLFAEVCEFRIVCFLRPTFKFLGTGY